jgi:hypothetical protein
VESFLFIQSEYGRTPKKVKIRSVSEQRRVCAIVKVRRKEGIKRAWERQGRKGPQTPFPSSQETLSSAIGAVPGANTPAPLPLMLILRGGASRLLFIPPPDPDPVATCP